MKEKKQKAPKERKKSFLPNLSNFPKLVKLLNALFPILLFSICIFVSYQYWIRAIGDGAYKYTDATYEHIENAIATCVIPEVGLDALALQKEVTKFVVSYENGNTELICSIRDGSYFNAIVTATFSEDYVITSNYRNYNSLGEYMDHFWLTFGLRVFISALIACLLIELSFLGISALKSWISKKTTNEIMKNSSEEEMDTGSTNLNVQST